MHSLVYYGITMKKMKLVHGLNKSKLLMNTQSLFMEQINMMFKKETLVIISVLATDFLCKFSRQDIWRPLKAFIKQMAISNIFVE